MTFLNLELSEASKVDSIRVSIPNLQGLIRLGYGKPKPNGGWYDFGRTCQYGQSYQLGIKIP